MLEDFRNASPLEFAAFFELGQFITRDIEAVSTALLTQGYDGENIANLAFGIDTTGFETVKSFQMALKEAGISRIPNRKESLWIAIRFFLKETVDNADDAIVCVRKLIDLYNVYGDVTLFDRPDCDTYFEEKRKAEHYSANKFAAQEWGIEKLYGIYYSSDDWNYGWTKQSLSYQEWMDARKKEQKLNAVSEASRVLVEFYNLKSDLPEDFKMLREFEFI